MPALPRLVVALILAALCVLGVECRTTGGPAQGPTRRPLEIAPGDLDGLALDERIARIEEARGLAFVQRPRVEVYDAEDPRLRALVAATPLELEKRESLFATRPLEHTAVDPTRERISTARPIDEAELDVALAFLLDAQHAPRLVRIASSARGDAGLALQTLFAASALATAAGGLGPPPEEPPADPLAGARIEPLPAEARALLGDRPLLAAQGFLRAQDDREEAFRRPPLSTEQILRPERWRRDDRPVWLAGAPPPVAGCALADDTSVGVFTLFLSLVDRGPGVPSRALSGWRGDRLLVWRCAGGPDRWLYAIEHDDEAGARAFAAVAETLLPPSLGAPDAVARAGRRVAVSSGLEPGVRDAFVASLRPRELRHPDDALGLGAPAGTLP
jgi:hypothetical protein